MATIETGPGQAPAGNSDANDAASDSDSIPERVRSRLFVLFQYLLPKRLLGRLVYKLSRSRAQLLKNVLIRGFVRLYSVDTSEAAGRVPQDYVSFNAFFTRRLSAGARPADPDPRAVTSPADGTVSEIGNIEDGRLFQAKGKYYSLTSLLGDDSERAARLDGGLFATIYLAPWNYHRLHMPLGGRLRLVQHVPGRLLSVNATTAKLVPGLFSSNQRVICFFESDLFDWAIVLVGALNVGSISLGWHGEIDSAIGFQAWDYPGGTGPELERGADFGCFNLGSTAIVLLPGQTANWTDDLCAGSELQVGTRIGVLNTGADS